MKAFLRRVRGWLRSARSLALKASGIAHEVAELARSAGWDVSRAATFLRDQVRAAARELGISDQRAEAMIKAAERELGHQLLLAALGELDQAIKSFKLPETTK